MKALHLRSVSLPTIAAEQQQQFPFTLPLIAAKPTIEFCAPVTFLVGENGSGKSTLLEAIALAAAASNIGSTRLVDDGTLAHVAPLARALKLVWRARTQQGFFLRAEDFFGFVKRVNTMRAELEAEEREVRAQFGHRSQKALGLALMPLRRELEELRRRYGSGLDAMSHGESFLHLFQSRFVANGLYLLDEPETPLSPLRQLALIAQIKVMVAEECQFIIATHSPILMAYPDAQILLLDGGRVEAVAYDQLEHVTLTRDFLNNPDQFLRYL